MVNTGDNSPPSAHKDIRTEIKERIERLSESQFQDFAKRFLIMAEEEGLIVYEQGEWRAVNPL